MIILKMPLLQRKKIRHSRIQSNKFVWTFFVLFVLISCSFEPSKALQQQQQQQQQKEQRDDSPHVFQDENNDDDDDDDLYYDDDDEYLPDCSKQSTMKATSIEELKKLAWDKVREKRRANGLPEKTGRKKNSLKLREAIMERNRNNKLLQQKDDHSKDEKNIALEEEL